MPTEHVPVPHDVTDPHTPPTQPWIERYQIYLQSARDCLTELDDAVQAGDLEKAYQKTIAVNINTLQIKRLVRP